MTTTCAKTSCEKLVTRKDARFCSLSCANTRPNYHQRVNKKRSCIFCQGEFEYKNLTQKYCGSSCAAKDNNYRRGEAGREKSKYCLNCGSTNKRNAVKYCSQQCGVEYRRNKLIASWLKGDWNGNVQSGLASVINIYLKEQAGWRCQSPTCAYPGGWSEINPVTGKVPVTLDHIDGDASNNRPDNLIVLCPSCHALTPTYGALNKNSTRTYRKKYYAKKVRRISSPG